jgi:hypothetical protein
MQHRKLAGVLIAAVILAISAFATTTAASAVTFELTNTECLGGTTIAICYQGSNLTGALGSWELEGEQSITAKGGTAILTVPSLESLEIRCTESVSTGLPVILQHEPLANGLTTIEEGGLVFKGCLTTFPTLFANNCTVPAEVQTLPLSGELESETDVVLTPESGTTFVTFEVKKKETLTCPVAFEGNLHVKGTELVNIVNAGTPELTKEGTSEPNSFLIYGETNPAKLAGSIIVSFTGLEDLVYISKIS